MHGQVAEGRPSREACPVRSSNDDAYARYVCEAEGRGSVPGEVSSDVGARSSSSTSGPRMRLATESLVALSTSQNEPVRQKARQLVSQVYWLVKQSIHRSIRLAGSRLIP